MNSACRLVRRFLGDRCCICGDTVRESADAPICTDCRRAIQSYRGETCPICGRPAADSHSPCPSCSSDEPSTLDCVVAIHLHIGTVIKLIQAYKMVTRPSLALYFADEVYRVLTGRFPGHTIVPVPGSRRGRKRRGFDQISLIADSLERRYRVAVQRCLKRDPFTIAQKHLSRDDRATNLQGRIHLVRGCRAPVRAVLLDDVTTTGTTLRVCAGTLRNGGTETCSAIALAIEP